jgi:RND family efflux transporter MFP subunit
MKSLPSLTFLLPALIAATAIAQAPKPVAAPASNGFDCLIEPNQRIDIRSPANALIEKVLVDRGGTVRVGDPLVVLDSTVEREAYAGAMLRAESESDIRVARARVDYAADKLRRREDLLRQNYISSQDRDDSAAELRVAQAEMALAYDNRRLAVSEAQRLYAVLKQRTLRAPFTGVVTERLQQPGELAFTGEGSARPILKMAQTNPLRVEVVLPVAMMGQVKPGKSAEIIPESPLKGSWQAQVRVIDRVFDSASGSFGVRLELPNPNGDIPAGVRCKVKFP